MERYFAGRGDDIVLRGFYAKNVSKANEFMIDTVLKYEGRLRTYVSIRETIIDIDSSSV